MVTIEHWTPEKQEAFKKEHPAADPKPWVVMDDKLVWGFYDTEEEAKKEAHQLEVSDEIGVSFGTWVTDTMDEYSVDQKTVEDIVKGQL